MICPTMRSSLLNSIDYCESKSFITYSLGIREKANIRADMGSAVHKSLELLALRKFAEQNKQTTITNEIFGGKEHNISEIDEETAFWLGWAYYQNLAPDYPEWKDEKSQKKYRKMYYDTLSFKNNRYNPLKLDIVQPEQYFEYEIKKDWAKYDYTINGTSLSGYLKIQGTVDLIIRNEDGSYSSLDWKTGKRVNWAFGEWHKPKVKEYDDLQNDKQLILYYFSLVQLLGTYDISSIIYYLQDGGPYELCFDEETYVKAEKMIKSEFEKINNIKVPRLTKNLGNKAENFYNNKKCSWCDFNKIQPKISTNKTVCEHFRSEVVQLGMDKVLDKYVKIDNLGTYQGGGRGEKPQ